MINLELAKKRNISDINIKYIEIFQNIVQQCVVDMEANSFDSEEHSMALANWRKYNAKLQKLWGFEVNPATTREWNLPKCSCPNMDNDDFGYHRYITLGCKIHGR